MIRIEGPDAHDSDGGLAAEGAAETGNASERKPFIDRYAHSREGLLVAGVALGIILLGSLLLALTRESTPAPPAGSLPMWDLSADTCYDVPPGFSDQGRSVPVLVTECDGPHDAKVLAQIALPDLPWSGTTAMESTAANQCRVAVTANSLPPEQASLVAFHLPSQQQWATTPRITCTLPASVR